MSVRGKRRTARHTHLEVDIKEGDRGDFHKPKSQGISMADVILDRDANVEYTIFTSIIKATRFWEGEWDDITKQSGTDIVTDATASGGRAIKRLSSEASATMWYGPYKKIGGGEYIAIFNVKVSSVGFAGNVIRLDVYSATKGNILDSGSTANGAYRDLSASDFRGGINTWHQFRILFTCQEDWEDVELRGISFATGKADVHMDWVGIIPANIAISGGLVVTGLDSHSGTVTDSHSGTVTDAHAGTVAALAFADTTEILNATDSNTAVAATTWTEIFSDTCSSESDAFALARILVTITRDATFTNRKYFIRLDAGGSIKDIRYGAHWGDGGVAVTPHQFYIFEDLSGVLIKVYLYAEVGASQYTCNVIVKQYKEHDHSMTDPDTHSETPHIDHVETPHIDHVPTTQEV